MTDLSRLAAAVISEARQMSGRATPEFDYDIKLHGVGGPLGPLGNATYTIATRDLAPAATDAELDARKAAADQLWADLQPELAAYAQRCRDRQYSGWSSANPSPIRYAS